MLKGWDHPCPHQALTQHCLWRDVEGARWLRLQGCSHGSALGLETLMPMEGGGLSFSSEPRFEPPCEARGGWVLYTSLYPRAVPCCNPPPPASSQGFFLPMSHQPPGAPQRDSNLRLSGQQPRPWKQRAAFWFFPISSWYSHGDGFPSSRKRATAGHRHPSGLWGGPAGC